MSRIIELDDNNILDPAGELKLEDDDLAIFVLNVGDGDSIVIRFPKDGSPDPLYAVIDSKNRDDKVIDLLTDLGIGSQKLAFVCATHPHKDHIFGLEKVVRKFGAEEFWDSGFRYTAKYYSDLIKAVTELKIPFIRPTAGYETYIRGAHLTVLSPSMALRNRYDTYGIDPNNASIVIKLEYPSPTAVSDFPDDPKNLPGKNKRGKIIILGGDAQTDAWAQVMSDFPHLEKDDTNWAQQIQVRQGNQPLFCDVFKVSHHASKHGVNLELLERLGQSGSIGITKGPDFLVASCDGDATKGYLFPHMVTQEIMREAREPLSSDPTLKRSSDHMLGIHYTSQQLRDLSNQALSPAGSVVVVFSGDNSKPKIYRLGDKITDKVDLINKARRVL